jgi:hypothetical protein
MLSGVRWPTLEENDSHLRAEPSRQEHAVSKKKKSKCYHRYHSSSLWPENSLLRVQEKARRVLG